MKTPQHPDPKAGERTYYTRIGAGGLEHARNKPFSDGNCGRYLSDFGALLIILGVPPRSILDLGCGAGWTSILLARAGYQVLGLDIAEDTIAVARETAVAAGLSGVKFHCADYEEFQSNELFDCALFYDALHHAEDEQAAVNAAYRALKPGGVLCALEPGAGHSLRPDSRTAVEKYGVHEKDMPPGYVWQLGQRAGFQRKLILPRPSELAGELYWREGLCPRNAIGAASKLLRSFLRVAAKAAVAGKRRGLLVMWK